tara:strand:- start:669 stop:1076 length:408 start_codon:yes stop_codon:yes gene_type:complete
MAFINPLTISLGTKLATSLGKKYGPKVVSKLKGMTSKKNLAENLLILGVGATQVARLKLMPKSTGEGRAEEIKEMRKKSSKQFATRKKGDANRIEGEPEKPFKEKKQPIEMDGVKNLYKGGVVDIVDAGKYFKHK